MKTSVLGPMIQVLDGRGENSLVNGSVVLIVVPFFGIRWWCRIGPGDPAVEVCAWALISAAAEEAPYG